MLEALTSLVLILTCRVEEGPPLPVYVSRSVCDHTFPHKLLMPPLNQKGEETSKNQPEKHKQAENTSSRER